MKNKTPIDNSNSLVITLSVIRKGTGEELSHYFDEKHIQSEGELKNLVKKIAKVFWDNYDIKSI